MRDGWLGRREDLLDEMARCGGMFWRFVVCPTVATIGEPLATPMSCLHPEPTAAIRRLRDEIAMLNEQQSEALEASIYLAMTRDQYVEYDNRHRRLSEIRRSLALLEKAQ